MPTKSITHGMEVMGKHRSSSLQPLIARMQAGDTCARREFLGQVEDRVQSLARNILTGRFGRLRTITDSKSVTNRTFVRLLTAEELTTPNLKEFMQLCARLIHNELIDIARRQKRRPADYGRGLAGGETSALDAISGQELEPSRHAEGEELLERVDALPKELRDIVFHHGYLGLRQSEIAELLNLDPKEVSRRWKKGQLILGRQLLSPESQVPKLGHSLDPIQRWNQIRIDGAPISAQPDVMAKPANPTLSCGGVSLMPHYTVSQAAAQLTDKKIISQQTASQLSQSDRPLDVAVIRRGFEDPVASCFIIDASPSMNPFRDAVIQGQQVMVNTLRGSAKCRKNALYIGQYLFSGTPVLLNPFTPLNPNGCDAVTLLDVNRYKPEDGSGTALYQTVFQVLQDMTGTMAYSMGQAIRTTFTIAVITDGEDNQSKVRSEDVKSIVLELREKGFLTRSLVIGIDNPDLSRAKIEAIRDTLGFEEAPFVGQSASEIRRAFALASQSAVKAQI